jgi:hypothetical protein
MKLMEQVRQVLRVRHYSLATEQCYCQWIRRFIFFHGVKHPNGMGAEEVEHFLTHLAVEGLGASRTQNQALAALIVPIRVAQLTTLFTTQIATLSWLWASMKANQK